MSELKPCPICGHAVESFEGNASCTNDPDCPLGCAVYPLDEWNATTERIRRLIAENRRAQPDTRKWQPIETAPRKTEILLAWHDGTKWHQDTGWVEDWEPDLSPEQMRWMPLPSLPAIRAQREGKP